MACRGDGGAIHRHPETFPVLALHVENCLAWQAHDVARDHIHHPTVGDDQHLLARMNGANVAESAEYAVGEFIHRFAPLKVPGRIALEDQLQFDRIEFGQLGFRHALEDAEVAFHQTFVKLGKRQPDARRDDLGGFACTQ